MIELNKIIHADCMDVMKDIPNESIDLVLTSPPYNLGNAKKGSFYNGVEREIKYNEHDDSMKKMDYIDWQRKILKECYRIIKNTGAIFYNHKHRILNGVLDDRKVLIPFQLRQEIIWNRKAMVNFSGGFFAPNTERIYIIAKDKWKVQKDYIGLGEVWEINFEQNTKHPAPFPIKLAETCIVSGCKENALVLDCFSGSGTTAIACIRNNRNYICIEKDKDYYEASLKRVDKELQKIKLF